MHTVFTRPFIELRKTGRISSGKMESVLEKKALFQFLLRIVSDLEAELDDAAGKRRDTAAAGKGLFPDVTEEVVKEVMAALRKDANLSYQLGAKQTVMFDRVIACVGGDGARQA